MSEIYSDLTRGYRRSVAEKDYKLAATLLVTAVIMAEKHEQSQVKIVQAMITPDQPDYGECPQCGDPLVMPVQRYPDGLCYVHEAQVRHYRNEGQWKEAPDILRFCFVDLSPEK